MYGTSRYGQMNQPVSKYKLSDISLIIPAYNEAQRIEPVVKNYCACFPEAEIIVVCNGCRDKTPEIATQLSLLYPNIEVLVYHEKLGKGGAIIEGFKHAHRNMIGFVDSDESVNPAEVMGMFEALSRADGIIASRRLSGSKIMVRQPIPRRLASKAFNILVRIIFGLHFKDTQCGAKVFTKEAVQSVLNQLTTNGFEFDVELLWSLKKQKRTVLEYPITWRHSEGSTFRLSNSPKMFVSLLRLRL